MQLVHNALNDKKPVVRTEKTKVSSWARQASFKAYKKALQKYAAEIAEIQKEVPGWLPKFNY